MKLLYWWLAVSLLSRNQISCTVNRKFSVGSFRQLAIICPVLDCSFKLEGICRLWVKSEVFCSSSMSQPTSVFLAGEVRRRIGSTYQKRRQRFNSTIATLSTATATQIISKSNAANRKRSDFLSETESIRWSKNDKRLEQASWLYHPSNNNNISWKCNANCELDDFGRISVPLEYCLAPLTDFQSTLVCPVFLWNTAAAVYWRRPYLDLYQQSNGKCLCCLYLCFSSFPPWPAFASEQQNLEQFFHLRSCRLVREKYPSK